MHIASYKKTPHYQIRPTKTHPLMPFENNGTLQKWHMTNTPPKIDKHDTLKKMCLTKMTHLAKKFPKVMCQVLSLILLCNVIQIHDHKKFFLLTVCSYHVAYAFQSESTIYSCLNVKELLTQNKCNIGNLSDCNGTQTHWCHNFFQFASNCRGKSYYQGVDST